MFDRFLGIDYSGEGTSTTRLPRLQVFCVNAGGLPEKRSSPTRSNNGGRVNWTRKEVAQLLLDEARSGHRVLVGIDHCFSFPASYFNRYRLADWPAFLGDFVQHWPLHEESVSVKQLRADLSRRPADATRCGTVGEFRVCERWTSSAKCVFQFGMQGSVAHSSHTGIPWLHWLRGRAGNLLHFWPFDGWVPEPSKSVIVEVYPAILSKRYEKQGRTSDEHDAYATARWMSDMAERDVLQDYFSPPLTAGDRAVAQLEGWILGVR